MTKTYVGDTGTEIILNCGTDISTATSVKINYKKPAGTTGSWTGAVYNTNYIKYTTDADDLDVAGQWLLQALVITASGEWLGETTAMTVYDSYK